MDTISPADLVMYRTALQRAQAAETQLREAQQQLGLVQRRHDAAIGAFQFALELIQGREGFPTGGTFHAETGEIVPPAVPVVTEG
jgi:hypothetical protein